MADIAHGWPKAHKKTVAETAAKLLACLSSYLYQKLLIRSDTDDKLKETIYNPIPGALYRSP